MDHLQALNMLIDYSNGKFETKNRKAVLEQCKANQVRRPYKLPDKPAALSIMDFFTSIVVSQIIGAIFFVLFGIAGVLNHYFVFGYVNFPAFKVGYFVLSLFGGESASVVTPAFISDWASDLTWVGFFAMVLGYLGIGILFGILVNLIRLIRYPSAVKAWEQRCVELTPEKFEQEEDERIANEIARQPRLESDYNYAAKNKAICENLIYQLHIPSQYLNAKSLKSLRSYILSGRAYTIADAINCEIQDQWRNEQANVNQEALWNAKRSNDYAKRTYDEVHDALNR